MKRKNRIATMLLLIILILCGCKPDMNYVIQNYPCISGVVEEVYENYVILYSDTMDGYPNGARCQISLDVEYQDSCTVLSVGDGIDVYYDGNIMETEPLRFENILAILLISPADRQLNEQS